jgi:hypothetical protein
MNDQSPRYLAFLLRLWCVDVEDGIVWRASLEDAHTGERRGFADLQIMYVFLVQQLEAASRQAHSAPIEKRGNLP